MRARRLGRLWACFWRLVLTGMVWIGFLWALRVGIERTVP